MKLVLDNGNEIEIKTQEDAKKAIALACIAEDLVKNTPCDECEHRDWPDETCNESCSWFDYDGVGQWQFLDADELEREYENGERLGCESSPIRRSSKWGTYIIPGRRNGYYDSNDLLNLLDEWESLVGLFYEFRWANKINEDGMIKGFDHAHSFEGVVWYMFDDPENFYIPKASAKHYSEQEIELLALVRQRLCHDMGVNPKCKIVDALDDEDRRVEDGQGNRFSIMLKKRIEQLQVIDDESSEE